MPSKPRPKLILEGTRPTRETDLAFALDGRPRVSGWLAATGGLHVPGAIGELWREDAL